VFIVDTDVAFIAASNWWF